MCRDFPALVPASFLPKGGTPTHWKLDTEAGDVAKTNVASSIVVSTLDDTGTC